MNSVNQASTSRRDREPNPAAIVGSILAFGVVRALARAQRMQDQAKVSAPQESPFASRKKTQFLTKETAGLRLPKNLDDFDSRSHPFASK